MLRYSEGKDCSIEGCQDRDPEGIIKDFGIEKVTICSINNASCVYFLSGAEKINYCRCPIHLEVRKKLN